MAESLLRSDRPTDEESLNFAKSLYRHIWIKFKVVQGIDAPLATEPADHSDPFHSDIGKAVLCEQILTRSFYKSLIFVSKRTHILKDTGTALTFCKIICEKGTAWDYFKRLFRYSALIGEFFLYRTQRMTYPQLVSAPLIWNAVFKKYFAKTFYANRGWEGFLEYSQKYTEIYPTIEIVIGAMPTPYSFITVDYEDSMPRDILVPLTDSGKIDEEMHKVFKLMQLYFLGKKKPKTPLQKHYECDIPEDSESESTGSSSSEKDFKSHRMVLDDVKRKRTKDYSVSKLDQPSCSTSKDITEYESSDEQSKEEGTSEEQCEEEGSGESLPSSDSEGKDLKRSPSMDYSGSEDPTQTE